MVMPLVHIGPEPMTSCSYSSLPQFSVCRSPLWRWRDCLKLDEDNAVICLRPGKWQLIPITDGDTLEVVRIARRSMRVC